MGYMRHHAIIVSSFVDKLIEAAHAEATRLEMSVTPIVGPVTNGTRSFLVGPDGSKEGWDESDAGDERRHIFVMWLVAQAYDDGSSSIGWAEVQYDDDDWDTHIVDSSDGRRVR